MNNIEAIIFDMDGVIVDSSWYWIEVLSNIIRNYGKEISEKDKNEISGCSDEYELEILSRYIDKPVETLKKIRKEYVDSHPINYGKHAKQGIHELLHYLKSQNIRIVLASSSFMVDVSRMMDELKIRDYFEVVMTSEKVQETKPHPQIYLDTLALLNLDSSKVIVIEDSSYGIESAKRANLDVLVLQTPEFDFTNSNFKIFKSHYEIIDHLEKQQKRRKILRL